MVETGTYFSTGGGLGEGTDGESDSPGMLRRGLRSTSYRKAVVSGVDLEVPTVDPKAHRLSQPVMKVQDGDNTVLPVSPSSVSLTSPGSTKPTSPGTPQPARPRTPQPASPGTPQPASPGTPQPTSPRISKPTSPGTEKATSIGKIKVGKPISPKKDSGRFIGGSTWHALEKYMSKKIKKKKKIGFLLQSKLH